MELIFLVYGLAFFLLGFAILYYPKKNSAFRLARKIHFVGWFGIFHGINEWLDLLILTDALGVSGTWETLRLITLPVSFLVLVYFGAEVISTQKKNCFFCKLFTPVLLIVWAVLFSVGEHNQLRWDTLSRYLLCFPGAMLTGLALFLYVPEPASRHPFRLALNLKIAGIGFLVYAFLAGLVVRDGSFVPASFLNYTLFSESIGVPVQVFRTVCAILVAYNLIRALEIFHLEMQQSIADSQMRFRTIVNTAPVALFIEDVNHTITFFEGKGLAGLNILPGEAVGQPASAFFASLPQIYQNSKRAFSSGETFTDIAARQDCFYEVAVAPLKSDAGTVCGVIGVVIDVSERKKAMNELEKYRIEMEKNKTLAAVGALSAEIAGQLTAPLQASKIALLEALGGLRKTIGAGEVKDNIRKGLENVSAAVKTLSGFCEKADLQRPLQVEPIDLYEIVQRVLAVFHQSAQQAMVRITTCGAEVFPVLCISSRELEQVFYIMIQNVIQSADGTHVHDLEVDFSIQKEVFRMQFYGNCPGHSTPAPAAAASGPEKRTGTEQESFGFSIVRGMIEGYAGTFTAAPDPRGGVRYEIQLPLAK